MNLCVRKTRALAKRLYESWTVDAAVVGSTTIKKLDYKENLVSGNFEVKLKRADGPDVIDLTEASFTDVFLQY